MQTPFEDARAYEGYIGRWSRVVAREFVAWLEIPAKAMWYDVACGTGALTSIVLATCAPTGVDASDPDETRIGFARRTIEDERARFFIGDGTQIAAPSDTYDVLVNGLGFPQIRETAKALAEFRRVTKPGGIVAGYVWDFDGEMQLLRFFWNAAAEFETDAESEDDSERFEICNPERLAAAWRAAGFSDVVVRAIDGRARFDSFDDFWTPFLRGNAPAQAHVAGLGERLRAQLRERLRTTLPIANDGSIELITRAWAAKGVK